jgi:hypothetical protein
LPELLNRSDKREKCLREFFECIDAVLKEVVEGNEKMRDELFIWID